MNSGGVTRKIAEDPRLTIAARAATVIMPFIVAMTMFWLQQNSAAIERTNTAITEFRTAQSVVVANFNQNIGALDNRTTVIETKINVGQQRREQAEADDRQAQLETRQSLEMLRNQNTQILQSLASITARLDADERQRVGQGDAIKWLSVPN